MKKVYSILSILLTIALIGTLVSCEKDQEVMLTAVSVTNEQITPMYNSATISSTISSEATIREVFVQYARTKDFAEYDEVSMQEIDGRYTAELLDLQDNTIYYYRYAASNRHSAIVLKTIHQFETLKPTVPTISLDTILTVWDSYAQVQITLSFDGGANVSEMGVCWGTNSEPTPEDNVLQTKDTVAVLNISSLEPNTQYYVRAYATNKIGVGYSQTYTFTTFAMPQVQSNDITDVQLTSAMLNGLLLSDGNDTAVVVGFCWSENEEPTISDTLQIVDIKDNIFSYYLSNLKDETQYFVRAFAQNRIGVAYGEVKAFTTASTVIPTVLTTAATQVTTNSAVVGGNVTDDGGAEVTERGIVYSTTPNPTTANSKLTSGSGVGEFTCDLTDLQSNATYYARAYAINKKGTAYGEEVSFTTNKQIVLPSITTNAITQITETSAVAGGNVTSDGNASVTERGVVYSTNPNPVITNLYNTIKPCGSGTGSFTCELTNLQPNTTYYLRAYATNSIGTAYGEEVSFTTEEEAVVSDPTGTENGYGYVDLGLSVKWATYNVGATSPEEYGSYFAWGEVEPKEVYDWSTYKWCNGSSNTLTKYNTSSSYGTVDNKTTLELSDDAARVNWGGAWRMPTDAEWTELRTECTWTIIEQNGVNGCKVTSKYNNNSIFFPSAGIYQGNSLVAANSNRNYWSSSLSIDIPIGAWTLDSYSNYIRITATDRRFGHSVRPVLGENEVEVTTPTVTTTTVTQITEMSAVAGGNVTSDGNASVTERGVVYSTNPNLVITNLYNTIKPCGSGTGSFTCELTNLQPNTTYYVRAYATNEKGTAYGEEVSFTTNKNIVLPSLITNIITQITETTAVAGGNVTSDGNASVTERGVVYSTNPNPLITNLYNTIKPCGSGTGSFTCDLTNLQPNTTYYVRAYATNSMGTAYGEEVSFTTEEEVVAIPEYVDLGLSVKWATFNVGATKPEEFGDYFAWGETEPKDNYAYDNYKWYTPGVGYTKYNNGTAGTGILDSRKTMEPSDDAATVNWGGDWRVPTREEFTELETNCTWTLTTENGVSGFEVTSKKPGYTTKSIFIPRAGLKQGYENEDSGKGAYYWSSTLYLYEISFAFVLYEDMCIQTDMNRADGLSIRPVYGPRVEKVITLPTVITQRVTEFTSDYAQIDYEIADDGGSNITEAGIVYSLSPNPTIADYKESFDRYPDSYTYDLTGLQPNTTYYVRAYAINEIGVAYGEELSFTTLEKVYIEPERIDLGLSVDWASFNVGASKPEEYGDYFAWGETEPKAVYNWSTYKWCNGYETALTKYNTDEWYGDVDNKTILESEDDAATIHLGNNWRSPHKSEIDELRNECTWSYVTRNGIYGYKVTGPSGKSIFLPAAKYMDGNAFGTASIGSYWSSSLSSPTTAWHLGFQSDYGNTYADKRYTGRTIRPVYGPYIEEPSLTTAAITQITHATAVAGGNVTADGGASVTERGVVYSTVSNPVINNIYHTTITSGSGTGEFTCNLTNLQAGTTYFVRAYAVNSKGTAYGEEVIFTTALQISLPSVTTSSISNITETTATTGGKVTADGNATVTERGVVYATTPNPTTLSNKVVKGSGTGSFTCNLADLQRGTTYYVRAYAINSAGTAYGEEVVFNTLLRTYENGHEYVDLGLPSGLKWATMNIDATAEKNIGKAYAWGELAPKSSYSLANYIWYEGNDSTMTKYNQQDNLTQLTSEDDVAAVNWGGNWRMPTIEEWRELHENCTWNGNLDGTSVIYTITGKNGNKIYLPGTTNIASMEARFQYWSSSLCTDTPSLAYSFNYIYTYPSSWSVSFISKSRYIGLYIRPVCP